MRGIGFFRFINCRKRDLICYNNSVFNHFCQSHSEPSVETFLKQGSKRRGKPLTGDGKESDIQDIGVISDRDVTADEMAQIKRAHWSIENRVHHVLDDTFREDRSPAKKSKNNLALIRKFAYNLLRIAISISFLAKIALIS